MRSRWGTSRTLGALMGWGGVGGVGAATDTLFCPQNRGIYMFRINNEHVIDATLTGGPAR